jgi:signal recognition particle subunit SRP54
MGGQSGGMAGMPGLPDMSPGNLPPELQDILNKKK